MRINGSAILNQLQSDLGCFFQTGFRLLLAPRASERLEKKHFTTQRPDGSKLVQKVILF